MKQAIATGLLVFLAACGRGSDQADTTTITSDTGGMGGMVGMGGMGGMGMGGMMSGAMMDSMQVHMRMMDTMSAEQMRTMAPMHEQMMGNVLTQMERDLQSMSVAADARWTALMDSVRQDAARMRDMSAEETKAFMTEHHGRMTRLMQVHRDLIGAVHR